MALTLGAVKGTITIALGDQDPTAIATFELPLGVIGGEYAAAPEAGSVQLTLVPPDNDAIKTSIAGALIEAANELLGALPVGDVIETISCESCDHTIGWNEEARIVHHADGSHTLTSAVGGRMIGSPLVIDPSPEHEAALAANSEWRRDVEPSDVLDGPEHLIFDGRQTGKTRLAMKWVLDAPEGVKRILIVPRVAMAHDYRVEFGLALNDDRIIAASQIKYFLRARGDHERLEFGVDETMWILTDLLGLRQMPHLVTLCTAAPWQGTQD